MIKWVVITTGSKANYYGNRYYINQIVNTTTGKRLTVYSGGCGGNVYFGLKEFFNLDHGEILEIEKTLPIRRFNAIKKVFAKKIYRDNPEIFKGLTK